MKNKIIHIPKYNHTAWWHIGCLLMLLSSCGINDKLSDKESLLVKNSIDFIDDEKVQDKSSLEFYLATFEKQKPNGNSLFLFPSEYFYANNSAPGDTSWWNNFLRKDIGEAPTIYDSIESKQTAQDMQLYLRNLKGYYDAEVNYTDSQKGKKTEVIYSVNTGDRYVINSIEYLGRDSILLEEINKIGDQALINIGDPIDAPTFDQEKNRLTKHLQNIGYATFKANRFKVFGDSIGQKKAVDIIIEVIPKEDGSNDKKYTVGQIKVFTDFFQGKEATTNLEETINGIQFYANSKNFVVNPKRLAKFISIKPGTPFNEEERVNTFKRLNSLDSYKFSIINTVVNEEDDNVLDYTILLTPHASKWISDFGIEGFYSTVSNVRQLFGTSAYASLENRNLFGGAERNRFNVEVGGEVGRNLDQVNTGSFGLATSFIRIQNNLEIPVLIDIFKTTALIKKAGLLSERQYDKFKRETRTNIGVGYNGQQIFSLYNIRSFSSSIGYSYIPNARHSFNIRQLALNLNSYSLEDAFLQRIGSNPLIINSLRNNLFTGFLFRDINYVYASRKSLRGSSFRLISDLEISGWETSLISKALGLEDPMLFDTYEFSKYYRIDLDARYYKEFSPATSFASRVNFGIARPFGDSDEIPYIKQFYAGGPNGIRAWQIRELGPGGYDQPDFYTDSTPLFFQQGDLKFQFSAEYRFDLVLRFESALFIDGGNVWTLDKNDTRINSQFSSDFLDDIALGYGWGLRYDFEYFNIRLDFAYKLRRPYANPNESRWIAFKGQRIGNINVAINYPY